MSLRTALTALLFIFFGLNTAQARIVSGNEILDLCKKGSSVADSFCVGYTIGLNEGIKAGAAQILVFLAPENGAGNAAQLDSLTNLSLQVCKPDGVSYQQLYDIFYSYLEGNPSERHRSARGLWMQALRDAFPCE